MGTRCVGPTLCLEELTGPVPFYLCDNYDMVQNCVVSKLTCGKLSREAQL